MPFCLNCDNRHGCKNALPLCLQLKRRPHEKTLRGRELMLRRGLTGHCPRCKDFQACQPSAPPIPAERGPEDEG